MQCAQAILLFYMVYVTRSSTVVGAIVGDHVEEEEEEEEEEVARCVIIYLRTAQDRKRRKIALVRTIYSYTL
eukprot:COSAG05_NODE_1280_length_5292_cov_3.009436_2_plen_72_part_00